jgi:trypsin
VRWRFRWIRKNNFWGKILVSIISGGPLVLTSTNEIVGITSFGADAKNGIALPFNDCESAAPSVFTRVSSYIDWIHEKTGLEL